MIQRCRSFLRSQTFSASTFLVLSSQVTRSGLVLLTWAIVGRYLGAQGLGKIQIAYLLPISVSIFLNLGLPVSNSYLVGKNQYSLDSIFGNNLLWSVAGSLAAVLALVIAKPLALHYFPIPPELFLAAVLWIPLQQLYSVLLSLVLAERRFVLNSWLGLINGLGMAVGTFLTAVVFKLGLAAVTWTLVGTTAALVGYLLWVYWPAHLNLLKPSAALVKESLRLGLKAYFGNMLQFFNYRLDVFIVAYFAGTAALGIYAVAYSVAELLWYIPQAVATVLMPVTSSSEAQEATSRTSRICRLSFGLGIFMGLAAAAIVPILVPRFLGKEYIKSISLTWILLPGAVSFVCAKILSADLAGRGRPEFGSYAAFGGLLVTVPMNLIFVPGYGATASAVISSAVYFCEAFFLLLCYHRLTLVSMTSLLVPRWRDISFVTNWPLSSMRIAGSE